MAGQGPRKALQGGQLNAAISNAVVHTFADYFGRGPTKARTSIRDDLVVCLLESTLTKAEQSLVSDGKEQLVLDTRRVFQETMRDDLVEAVQALTRRKVVAFTSSNHVDPDVAMETFLLTPSEREPIDPDGV